MNRIDAILSRFPQYAYDPGNESEKSSLYKLIESIVAELDIVMEDIDRLNNMINIDTTLPDDLYDRWGALLDIKRNENETDEQYRGRLKVSVTALSGGTADAIKYAIACGLGINNDPVAMNRISVYDAWDYDGDGIVKDYGHVVCDIDLDYKPYSTDTERLVTESANNVKASGVSIQFIYRNFRVIYYYELSDITYASLNTLTYSQVGE